MTVLLLRTISLQSDIFKGSAGDGERAGFLCMRYNEARMRKFTFPVLLFLMFVIVALVLHLSGGRMVILDPKGAIASKELALLRMAIILMAFIGVIIYTFALVISWRYRAENKAAHYMPNWQHSTIDEALWWFVPSIAIAVLATITWQSSHALDPFRPLEGAGDPLVVEVIALPWKWLFIYPEEEIATINYAHIPSGRAVDFRVTADAPMNSFWIPELGGQIYAMTGMRSRIHLIAAQPGFYTGSSANFSGRGFSDMRFTAHVSSREEFDLWVRSVRSATSTYGALTKHVYDALARPSVGAPVQFFSSVQPGLYATIVNSFMEHSATH